MYKVQEIDKQESLQLDGKYIFHGSHNLFDICKPHQAHCNSKRQENEQFAIYGSDNLSFAILFAFEKLPKDNFSWAAASNNNGNYYGLLRDGTYIDEDDFGYLYCFDKAYFRQTKQGSCQYVCSQELEPCKIFKIYYRDYKELFEVDNSSTTDKNKN